MSTCIEMLVAIRLRTSEPVVLVVLESTLSLWPTGLGR